MNKLVTVSQSVSKSSLCLNRCSSQIPRRYCSTATNSNENIDDYSDEPKINYNKSRLEEKDYKKYHGIPTPLSDVEISVSPLSKLREEYGVHGAASGIAPRYLWPSKEELALLQEYEKVHQNNLTLPEMIAKARKEKKESITFTINRQKKIVDNMKKLGAWKQAVYDNIANKEKEARLAREKREQLIEEVRLMFGVRMDPKDEKFQEAIAKKELEEKKAAKALKKQQKQQKMLEQLKMIAEAEKEKVAAQKADSGTSTS